MAPVHTPATPEATRPRSTLSCWRPAGPRRPRWRSRTQVRVCVAVGCCVRGSSRLCACANAPHAHADTLANARATTLPSQGPAGALCWWSAASTPLSWRARQQQQGLQLVAAAARAQASARQRRQQRREVARSPRPAGRAQQLLALVVEGVVPRQAGATAASRSQQARGGKRAQRMRRRPRPRAAPGTDAACKAAGVSRFVLGSCALHVLSRCTAHALQGGLPHPAVTAFGCVCG
jgi:uncharacterized Fe-S cluster protein YjdI